MKLFGSIMTVRNLAERKYYPSRHRFAKTRGARWIYSVSSKPKKGLAAQSKIVPLDEDIFIARCELSRENKNEKTKPDQKNK